jgi:Sec-independent protein secretion pathway component TatC
MLRISVNMNSRDFVIGLAISIKMLTMSELMHQILLAATLYLRMIGSIVISRLTKKRKEKKLLKEGKKLLIAKGFKSMREI